MSDRYTDLRERLSQVPDLEAGTAPDWSRTTPPGARHSAVLLLFSDGHGSGAPDVLLTERSLTLRSHAGQVSFPGGGIDTGDDGPAAAALREAQEETGVDAAGIEVVGMLTPMYLPPSGHVVAPVLAWWHSPSVVRAPLAELLDPANQTRVRHPSGYVGLAFRVRGLFVWGFTAGLLERVLGLAGYELAPDPPLEDLPAEVLARLP